MTLKTLLKLAIRSISIIILFNCFVSGIHLISFMFFSQEARELHIDTLYIELARFLLGLIFGIILFKFPNRFVAIFGMNFNFEEKLDTINVSSMVTAIYCIFGTWLIVFSVPDLIEEIIRLQTSYYGAAINDLTTAIQKYSIVGDLSRILIGIVLVKYNKWLPPLNSATDVV